MVADCASKYILQTFRWHTLTAGLSCLAAVSLDKLQQLIVTNALYFLPFLIWLLCLSKGPFYPMMWFVDNCGHCRQKVLFRFVTETPTRCGRGRPYRPLQPLKPVRPSAIGTADQEIGVGCHMEYAGECQSNAVH